MGEEDRTRQTFYIVSGKDTAVPCPYGLSSDLKLLYIRNNSLIATRPNISILTLVSANPVQAKCDRPSGFLSAIGIILTRFIVCAFLNQVSVNSLRNNPIY